jgi:hypothetical protein
MNQPDSLNVQNPVESIANADINAEAAEANKAGYREWFPEDEDEWYEPDYIKNDRRAS